MVIEDVTDTDELLLAVKVAEVGVNVGVGVITRVVLDKLLLVSNPDAVMLSNVTLPVVGCDEVEWYETSTHM